MNNNDTRPPAQAAYSPFAPMLLILIGLITILAWNLTLTVRQTANLHSLKFQIEQATLQSAQTEGRLMAMLTDLLALSPGNPDAADIVKRYGIKQNSPPVSATP